MTSYRPICDVWFLTRAKLKGGRKYYGAYLGGFPERARILLGAGMEDPVLHACGGLARYYPYAGGFGPNDRTFDADPSCEPDFIGDARFSFPYQNQRVVDEQIQTPNSMVQFNLWDHILIDPPYSEVDAEKYAPGRAAYPTPNQLIRNAIQVLRVGGRVGLIHYQLPQPPKSAKFIAAIGVLCGFNNRVRLFSVFERRE